MAKLKQISNYFTKVGGSVLCIATIIGFWYGFNNTNAVIRYTSIAIASFGVIGELTFYYKTDDKRSFKQNLFVFAIIAGLVFWSPYWG